MHGATIKKYIINSAESGSSPVFARKDIDPLQNYYGFASLRTNIIYSLYLHALESPHAHIKNIDAHL